MEFSIKSGSPEKLRSACVVVGVFEPRGLTLPAELLDKAAGGYISDIISRGDMEGKTGRTLLLHNVPGTLCGRVLLVGLGKEKEFHEKEFLDAIRVAVKPILIPRNPIRANAVPNKSIGTAPSVEGGGVANHSWVGQPEGCQHW